MLNAVFRTSIYRAPLLNLKWHRALITKSPRSLQVVLVLSVSAVMSVLIGCSVLLSQYMNRLRTWEDFEAKNRAIMLMSAPLLTHALQDRHVDEVQRLSQVMLADPDVQAVAVFDAAGRRLVGAEAPGGVLARAITEETLVGTLGLDPARSSRYPARSDGDGWVLDARPVVATGSGDVVGVVAVRFSLARVEHLLFKRLLTGITAGCVIVCIVALLMWAVLGRLTRPIRALADVARRLALGDVTAVVPARDRDDEVGALARAMQLVKDGIEERDALERRSERDRDTQASRQARIEALVSNFRSAAREALATVAANSEQMTFAARTLTGIATESAKRATAAARATRDASESVRAVSLASDALTAAIGDIDGQVSQTRGVVVAAACSTRETRATVQSLAGKAQDIGEVVSLIQAIAAQTNLLALNATIEAARAGEAGRGFAVVASEVKNLAGETARATERIADQIGTIQAASASAVAAIEAIARRMEEVEGFTAGIVGAVERQALATGEIVEGVARAASGTESAAQDMRRLDAAVGETDQSAAQVNQAAIDVADQAKRLHATVDRFLDSVSAA